MTPDQQLLTPDQLAHRLNVCRATVLRSARAGKIESVKIGGSVRFTPEQVQKITRDGWRLSKPKEENHVD